MLKGLKIDRTSNAAVLLKENVGKLVLIKCECGTKILLLPDLKEMDRAIETHIAEHKKMEKSIKKAKAALDKIRLNLAQQTIRKASEIALAPKQFGLNIKKLA